MIKPHKHYGTYNGHIETVPHDPKRKECRFYSYGECFCSSNTKQYGKRCRTSDCDFFSYPSSKDKQSNYNLQEPMDVHHKNVKFVHGVLQTDESHVTQHTMHSNTPSEIRIVGNTSVPVKRCSFQNSSGKCGLSLSCYCYGDCKSDVCKHYHSANPDNAPQEEIATQTVPASLNINMAQKKMKQKTTRMSHNTHKQQETVPLVTDLHSIQIGSQVTLFSHTYHDIIEITIGEWDIPRLETICIGKTVKDIIEYNGEKLEIQFYSLNQSNR